MKRIITIALVLAAVLSFCSCAQQENPYNAPQGKLVATNEAVAYYFFYPADGVWMPDKNDGMVSVLSDYDQVGGTCTSSVSVTDFQFDRQVVTSAKQYWETNLATLKATFPDLVVTKMEDKKIAELDGYYVEYTAKVTDKDYKFAQAIVLNMNRAYIITYTTQAETFETRLPIYLEMVDTFRFK